MHYICDSARMQREGRRTLLAKNTSFSFPAWTPVTQNAETTDYVSGDCVKARAYHRE